MSSSILLMKLLYLATPTLCHLKAVPYFQGYYLLLTSAVISSRSH